MTRLILGSIILVFALIAIVATVATIVARVRLSNKDRTSGSLGHALSHVQSLIEPARKNMIETERVDERRRDDRSGDPPPRP
jgi:hypothetical protein